MGIAIAGHAGAATVGGREGCLLKSDQEIREGISSIIHAIPKEKDACERLALREKILALRWVLGEADYLVHDAWFDKRFESLLKIG